MRAEEQEDWSNLARVIVGYPRASYPDAVAVLEEDGAPMRRFDIYGCREEYHFKMRAVIWGDWFVFGFGERVVLVSRHDDRQLDIGLGMYFIEIREAPDYLLAVSGSGIARIDGDGGLRWHTRHLGIDAVVIDRIEDGVIVGQGEWDPPGGWRPFRISLATGAPH